VARRTYTEVVDDIAGQLGDQSSMLTVIGHQLLYLVFRLSVFRLCVIGMFSL